MVSFLFFVVFYLLDIWTGDNGDNNDEDDDMGQYGGQKDNVNPDGSNVDDDSNIEGNGDDYDIWEKLDNNENGLRKYKYIRTFLMFLNAFCL